MASSIVPPLAAAMAAWPGLMPPSCIFLSVATISMTEMTGIFLSNR
jgi:hypothetical protein